MRRKPYPAAKLTGGLNKNLDGLFLTDIESPELDIVRFHKGIVKKDYGFASFANVSSERAMLIYNYLQTDGDEYLILMTDDAAYQLSSGSWSMITSSDIFTGDGDDMFYATTMENLFIVTNGNDAIQEWNGSAWATLSGLASVTAKFVEQFYNHLIIANTVESGTAHPMRIKWSIVGDPETYTGTGSGFIDIEDTQDHITGLKTLGDKLFVFKQSSIWEVIHIGGTDVFDLRLISDSVGTYAGRSIVSTGTVLIFFGADGIYLFDGLNVEKISDPLFTYLFETGQHVINNSKLNRAHAIYYKQFEEYILVLPTVDNEPDLIIKYSIRDKNFTKRTRECTCLGYYKDTGGFTPWSSATGTWTGGSWDIPWKEGALPKGADTILYGNSSGTVVRDNRGTDSSELMVWQSKDFVFAHNVRWREIRIVAQGDAFDLSYSIDQGLSWSDEVTLTPQSNYFSELSYFINITSMRLRIRIRSYNADVQIKWVEPWYIERQRSVA